MKKQILALISILYSFGLSACPQLPDYIIYGKDTMVTYNLILEQYLQSKDTAHTPQLHGLSFRKGATFNCWRGYQAIYKIENDSLFLTDIINCWELENKKIDKAQSQKKMKSIFGDKLKNGKVFIDWFDGSISFPLTNKILRWDGVFYKIFMKEKVITISKGLVQKIEDVDNYVDDPNRIDRRYKDKISDVLFESLKKTKWKNPNNFDCSEEYLVTIDQYGIVSKVRMLYSDEEIKEYFEQGEYDFCVNKVLYSLKDLKFDIIKDKGKPISEDIYINIWIDDDSGKIENQTD